VLPLDGAARDINHGMVGKDSRKRPMAAARMLELVPMLMCEDTQASIRCYEGELLPRFLNCQVRTISSTSVSSRMAGGNGA